MLDKSKPIAIDKGVPMPKTGSGAHSAKYPWREMEIGDSFLFEAGKTITQACGLANKSSTQTTKYKCRTTPDGVRCWRVA